MINRVIAMLEESKSGGKGVTLFLPGDKIAIVVSEVIGTEAVVGSNREYDHVIVRLDQVVGCAMN